MSRNVKNDTFAEQFETLQVCSLLKNVPPALLEECWSLAKIIRLERGDALLTPSQINESVYIVLSGRLSVELDDAGHNQVAIYGQGESVGEISMFTNKNTYVYIVAETECELLAISHAAMWELVAKSHHAATNLLHTLSQHNMFIPLGYPLQAHDSAIQFTDEHKNGFRAVEMIEELTGLYNRKWMLKELERYIQRCLRDQRSGSLVLLEIDDYVTYKNTYGELGGDQALRSVAHTILSCLRPEDQAGHYSGAKFIVFLPHTPSLVAACVATERLRIAIRDTHIVLPSGDSLPSITVSIGVCQMRDDGLSGLIARTKTELRRAQKEGGDCISFMKVV